VPSVCERCGDAVRTRGSRFCSRRCYGADRMERPHTGRYSRTYAPDHPLANSRGIVQMHRFVLFAVIGPGAHPCHWCGRMVEWRNVTRGDRWGGHLLPDHLDNNGLNNDPGNLVPSCIRCNATRGGRHGTFLPTTPSRMDGGARKRLRPARCETCGKDFMARMDGVGRFCSRACVDPRHRAASA
jgi:hypothetical protein